MESKHKRTYRDFFNTDQREGVNKKSLMKQTENLCPDVRCMCETEMEKWKSALN